jgi:hypothetical protein
MRHFLHPTTINFGTKTHQKPYNIGVIQTANDSNDASCSGATISKRAAIEENFLIFSRGAREHYAAIGQLRRDALDKSPRPYGLSAGGPRSFGVR